MYTGVASIETTVDPVCAELISIVKVSKLRVYLGPALSLL